MIFLGQSYKDISEILYILLVQHFFTSGPVSNIIAKHKKYKNGKCCYLDLKGNFLTDSHYKNKYQHTKKKITEEAYKGGGD